MLFCTLIGNCKRYQVLENLLLRDLRGLPAVVVNQWPAATLQLTRTQCRDYYESVFTVDCFWNVYQSIPPKEAMISRIRSSWYVGRGDPEHTIVSRSPMDSSNLSLMTT